MDENTNYSVLPIDPDFQLTDQEFFHTSQGEEVYLHDLFSHLNGIPPCTKEFNDIDTNSFLRWLQKSPAGKRNLFIKWNIRPGKNEPRLLRFYILLSRKFIIWGTDNSLFLIYHPDSGPEQIIKISDLIIGLYRKSDKGNCIYFIDNFLDFSGHTILSLKQTILDIGLIYNDDFNEVNDKIVRSLNSGIKEGFIILTGDPGNGKTTYLKYLTSVCYCKFLYLSKWITRNLDIFNFQFVSYIDPVLILEDVDEILDLVSNNPDSMVNYLNKVVRGRFDKGIDMPVIITINAPLDKYKEIERTNSEKLIAYYDFKPLSEIKARNLVKNIGKEIEINGPTPIEKIFKFQSA